MSVTIRIADEVHAIAQRLAVEQQRSIGDVVGEAITRYHEERWWNAVDAAYARVNADAAASAELAGEIAVWDAALQDGLDDWPYEGIDELITANWREKSS